MKVSRTSLQDNLETVENQAKNADIDKWIPK